MTLRRQNDHPRSARLIDKRMKLAVAAALGDATRFRDPLFPPPALAFDGRGTFKQRCARSSAAGRSFESWTTIRARALG
jgi:hypothetical protein